jgi:glucosamine kinase
MTYSALQIGVDGGGTSCRVAILHRGQRWDVQTGPANVSTDFDGAIASIRAGLAKALGQAGLTPGTLADASAHLGLAGVMSAAIAARVRAALPLPRATVTDDRPTSIVGALGNDDGTVAAIGTGSFVGRQKDGQIAGLGGWGFFIGDQAAGAWLLRRCLEETMLAHDGLRPETDLTRAMLAEHGGDPGSIVLFAGNAAPADYARLAGEVVKAADAGDPLGRTLMDEGTAYIRAALARLGWAAPEPLVLMGGLGPAYARWMGLDLVQPRGTALDGALTLAGRTPG